MKNVANTLEEIKPLPDNVCLKSWNNFLLVMREDNGKTPVNFNSTINVIRANKNDEYKCSHTVFEVMLDMQKQYTKLLEIYYNHYKTE